MNEMGREREQEELEQDEQDHQDFVETNLPSDRQEACFVEGNDPIVRPGITNENQRNDVTKDAMNSFYKEIKNFDGFETIMEDTNIFSLDSKGLFYADFNGEKIRLTKTKRDKSGRRFLASSTLQINSGSINFITRTLGLEGYKNPATQLIEEVEAVSDKIEKITNEDGSVDELDEALDQLQEIAQQSSNLNPEDTNSEFTPREIRSLDESLQTIIKTCKKLRLQE